MWTVTHLYLVRNTFPFQIERDEVDTPCQDREQYTVSTVYPPRIVITVRPISMYRPLRCPLVLNGVQSKYSRELILSTPLQLETQCSAAHIPHNPNDPLNGIKLVYSYGHRREFHCMRRNAMYIKLCDVSIFTA